MSEAPKYTPSPAFDRAAHALDLAAEAFWFNREPAEQVERLEARIKFADDGKTPVDSVQSRQDPGIRRAYSLIEEFMLLANEVVARAQTQGVQPPLPHPAPAPVGGACGVAVVLIDVDQVDVAGHVELARAQLAHAHDPQFGAAPVGRPRRAVQRVQLGKGQGQAVGLDRDPLGHRGRDGLEQIGKVILVRHVRRCSPMFRRAGESPLPPLFPIARIYARALQVSKAL